jgi:YhcH/YjgK/YiaL family protein
VAVIGELADVLRRVGWDPGIRLGLEHLGTLGAGFLASEAPGFAGRRELDGDRVVALYQVYRTRDPAAVSYEAHRRHVDLQFVVRGEERLRLARPGTGRSTGAYDPDRDVEFFEGLGWQELALTAGAVVILYPEDLHAPGLHPGHEVTVVKAVVKVRA